MDDLDKYRDLLNHQESDSEDELAEFLRKSGEVNTPSRKSKSEIWDAIETAIDKDEKKSKSIPIWRYVSIAAAVTLLVTFSVLFFTPSKEIQVLAATGENKIELLPDGSKVILNASSSIEYNSRWNRQLKMDGEAFFEVTEGERFIVSTYLGSVEVLGTSFNVFARDEDFEVSCKSGRVRVTIPSKSFEEVIEAGEIIQMKSDTVKQITRTPELVGKWQKGEFYFEDQPIQEVFEELERQFNITIEFEEQPAQNFSGYFTNKDLENALDMVCLPLGLVYRRTGQDIYAISTITQ